MALIHHHVAGSGRPPIVFVHGFGCSLSDWDAQVAHLAPRHQTIAVDLPGHGATPGVAEQCGIEAYGADVAAVMRALGLPPAMLVGHSMGCRVAIEAALQAPEHAAGVVLVDGSQFSAAMEATLQAAFATPEGYAALIRSMFSDMFTARSDPSVAARVVERAGRLPPAIGQKVMLSLLHYDVSRLEAALSALQVPVFAIQATYSNERRERQSLRAGQTTPYLEMLRARTPSARIVIIAETGHFPQLDQGAQTNAALDSFLADLPSR